MKKVYKILPLIYFCLFVSCSSENTTEEYSITTSVSPLEGGSISPNSGVYTSGKSIMITANPSDYYEFLNWEGDVTGTSNPLTLNVDSNKIITAVFVKIDKDEDGIPDNLDNCPNTQIGETVDNNGCSESQLVGNTMLLFDKFWFTDNEFVYQKAKKIIYSSGTAEGYVNDQLYYSADWVWENESLGIIKLYNVQGTNQPYSTIWQKFNNIDEHSHEERQSTDQINYSPEVLWVDTDN